MAEDKKMAQANVTTLEQAKRNVIEYLWLKFFNDNLFSQGFISEQDHRKMFIRIAQRKSEADKRNKQSEKSI